MPWVRVRVLGQSTGSLGAGYTTAAAATGCPAWPAAGLTHGCSTGALPPSLLPPRCSPGTSAGRALPVTPSPSPWAFNEAATALSPPPAAKEAAAAVAPSRSGPYLGLLQAPAGRPARDVACGEAGAAATLLSRCLGDAGHAGGAGCEGAAASGRSSSHAATARRTNTCVRARLGLRSFAGGAAPSDGARGGARLARCSGGSGGHLVRMPVALPAPRSAGAGRRWLARRAAPARAA